MSRMDAGLGDHSVVPRIKRLGVANFVALIVLIALGIFVSVGLAQFVWQCVFLIGSGCDLIGSHRFHRR